MEGRLRSMCLNLGQLLTQSSQHLQQKFGVNLIIVAVGQPQRSSEKSLS